MSHVTPENGNALNCFPGPIEHDPKGTVQMRVMNHGNTPATVTEAFLTFTFVGSLDELPEAPTYEGAGPGRRAFLVKNDYFYFTQEIDLTHAQWREKFPKGIVIVHGFVDYTDAFGIRHRGGFVRRYEPAASENNLVFFNYLGWLNDDQELNALPSR